MVHRREGSNHVLGVDDVKDLDVPDLDSSFLARDSLTQRGEFVRPSGQAPVWLGRIKECRPEFVTTHVEIS